MARFISFLAILCMQLVTVQAQEHSHAVETMVKRTNKDDLTFFEISTSGFAHATPQQAWRVLTDYERLPEFVPNLLSSKLVSHNDSETLVEQESRASFLFISQNIRIVMRVIEQPYSAIRVTLVSGDMKRYEADWELAPSVQDGVDGTRITYSGKMEPNFFVPPLIGAVLVQRNVNRMMTAVIAEIDKTAR